MAIICFDSLIWKKGKILNKTFLKFCMPGCLKYWNIRDQKNSAIRHIVLQLDLIKWRQNLGRCSTTTNILEIESLYTKYFTKYLSNLDRKSTYARLTRDFFKIQKSLPWLLRWTICIMILCKTERNIFYKKIVKTILNICKESWNTSYHLSQKEEA